MCIARFVGASLSLLHNVIMAYLNSLSYCSCIAALTFLLSVLGGFAEVPASRRMFAETILKQQVDQAHSVDQSHSVTNRILHTTSSIPLPTTPEKPLSF